jgi:DNA methyltransferase 1-associated protein 1
LNRKIEVVRYANDEEYAKAIEILNRSSAGGVAVNTDWTKEETDHLFDLCEQFSLRFIVIADRFGLNFESSHVGSASSQKKRDAKALAKQSMAASRKSLHERTVDEIKDRYYSVAKAVLELRGQTDHQIVKKPFSYE